MGKVRKPVALQKGHLTVYTQQQRQQEEQAVKTRTDEILNPPAWLSDTLAKNEWKRIIPQLLEIDIVGNLDLASIAGYCNAYAQYRHATDQLKTEPLVYHTADEKTGYESHKENPTIKVQTNAAAEMRKFASLCGLTIDSRLKAAATKTIKKEDEIEDKFGVI